jgi:hypothetical protein
MKNPNVLSEGQTQNHWQDNGDIINQKEESKRRETP